MKPLNQSETICCNLVCNLGPNPRKIRKAPFYSTLPVTISDSTSPSSEVGDVEAYKVQPLGKKTGVSDQVEGI